MLLAAGAVPATAEAFSRAGDRRPAAAALRRAKALAASCEGATTPGLCHAAVPLSGRERQIAMLAVKGMASKDIAERLFLSVRTVSNHLQHAYTKLGVASRAGLAEALGSSRHMDLRATSARPDQGQPRDRRQRSARSVFLKAFGPC
jgi:DNA-binding CsgD family transcriptional regulator